MKITLPRKELKEALLGLARVVPRKATLPVLQCVRLSVDEAFIRMTGTDLDQTLTYRFTEARAEGTGAVLLNLEDLQLLAKSPSREPVVFRVIAPTDVEVVSQVGEQPVTHHISAESVDEWPSAAPIVEVNPVDSAFLPAFRRAAACTSDDASRPVLGGVFLEIGKPGDTLVGTDGRRLTALGGVMLPLGASCVVPTSKFLTSGQLVTSDLRIGSNRVNDVGWFRLVTPQWDYQARTIEGTYPNWRQVVPPSNGQHQITLHDEDAQVLLRALPTFPGREQRTPSITLVAEDGKLAVLGQGSDDKQPSRLDLTRSASKGGNTGITLDRRYFTDALESGFRAFAFANNQSPLLADDGRGGIHVLMPMRTAYTPAPAPEPVAEPVTTKEEAMKPESVKPEPTAMDRLLAAYEVAKTKVREANEALGAIALSVKDVLKEDKQRRAEIDSVRTGLARLQSIKV